MKHTHDSESSRPDRIGRLVKLAGRRPAPDPARMAHARAAARLEWTRIVERRSWRVAFWSLAAAAMVIVAVGTGGWFLMRRPSVPAVRAEIATVEAVTGTLLVTDPVGNRRTENTAGMRLRAGDRIETASDSRAALRVPDSISVRLDRNTAAVLDSASRLILDRGAAYVDAGPGAGGSVLYIDTSFGVVRHTGTQFEVRLDDSALSVRVREGSVAVERSGERWTSSAGEALVLARGRPPERRSIATSGLDWSWVTGVAPPFRLEGATASAFLEWVSREQGWRREYDDPALGARVQRTILHGSIEGLTPDEALAAVLPTTGLTSRLEGDRLIVSAASR